MECLECALLEWGPSPCPTLASRNGCPREYCYLAGRQAPVETVREFMAAVPRPNWANRARCVLLSAIDHVRNVGAILLNTWSLRSSQKRFTQGTQRIQIDLWTYEKIIYSFGELLIYIEDLCRYHHHFEAISDFAARKILQLVIDFYTR